MKEVILCKYGEIALKGANRRQFENLLLRSLRYRFSFFGKFEIYTVQSTIYIEPIQTEISMDVLFEEAKKGDELCNRAIDEMCDVLGKGIANICYVINPEIVVLGGGIMAQEEFLKDRIKAAMDKYLVSSIAKHTKLAFAKHQNDAGMLGAFYHFCSLH